MKNSISPKALFYGFMLIVMLLAMALNACKRGPEIIVKVPPEAWGTDTTNYQVQRVKDDNTVILKNTTTGDTIYMEVENAYSQAYEEGLIITLIK